MGWFRMPLFVRSLYAPAWVQVIATAVVRITLPLAIADRVLGVGFFDPARGGDTVLFKHLFRMYSHPAVYIMMLPAMGAISEIIQVFARRTTFGHKAIAFSGMVIAIVGYLFALGGLTGLVNGSLAANVHTHDTSFVVGHSHCVMFGGTGFAFFAALHYWFPKMFGRKYNRKAAKIAWGVMFATFNTLNFAMFILGWEGMLRRYHVCLPQYHRLHFISTVGSWILFLGPAIVFANLIRALRRGERAEANPLPGKEARAGAVEAALLLRPDVDVHRSFPGSHAQEGKVEPGVSGRRIGARALGNSGGKDALRRPRFRAKALDGCCGVLAAGAAALAAGRRRPQP